MLENVSCLNSNEFGAISFEFKTFRNERNNVSKKLLNIVHQKWLFSWVQVKCR